MSEQIQKKPKPKEEDQEKEEERPGKKITQEELDKTQDIIKQLEKSQELFDEKDLDEIDQLIETQPDELLDRQTEGGE